MGFPRNLGGPAVSTLERVSLLIWGTSFDALTYGVSLMVAVLFFIVAARPRSPITVTLEWARQWADPERRLRSRRGTYRFFVPALIVTIIGTFVVPLLWR